MLAYWGLLFYTVCVYLRLGEWIPALNGIQFIVAIITLFFWVKGLIFRNIRYFSLYQDLFLVMFFIVLILSHISHLYFGGIIKVINEFGKIVLIYFAIVSLLNSNRRIKVYLWFLIILTTFLAWQGIKQNQIGIGLGGMTLKDNRIRGLGIFNDPNDLALAFVMTMPFIVVMAQQTKKLFLKLFLFLCLGLLGYALYLTNSRGGMIACMVTILFYFAKKTRNLWGIVLGSLFVIIIFLLGPSRLSNLSPQEASAYGRIDAWYTGFQMLTNAPLLGVGYDMFTFDYYITAHNSYMLVAAESGILGLFFWIGIIYLVYKNLSFIQRSNKEYAESALGLQTSLVGFLSAAFFISRSYIIIPYFLFAISGAAFNIYLKPTSDRLNSQDILSIAGISVGILLIIYILVKFSV